MLLLATIACSLITYYLWSKTRKPPGFPPGPPRKPLFGRVVPSFHGVADMVDEYKSKIVGFYMGNTPVVMITDFAVLKDLFKREELSSRPPNRPLNELKMGHEAKELNGRAPGITFSDGRYWREQRRFVLRHLRDFGFGKSSMEDTIHAEVEKLCKVYKDKSGAAFSPNRSVNVSIINSLWTILVGDSFQLDDPNLISIVEVLETTLRNNSTALMPLALLLPHPSLVKLPFLRDICGFTSLKAMQDTLYGMIDPYIKQHKRTFDRAEMRDLMDLVIRENKDTTDAESPFFGSKGGSVLYNTFIELFLAGMETTSFSLVWTFLYMIHHPDVQEKVHREMDKVCGREKLPSLSDQPCMPYTNAVLHESLRLTGLLYNGFPHFATKEVSAGPYTIPKGSLVYGCLHRIMNDPEHWDGDPEVFRPDRFLHPETGEFTPSERVIPFGIGKRICLGMSLAEKQFFLFFTGVMQRFELCRTEGELPGYGVKVTSPRGLQRHPPHYTVVMKARSDTNE